MMDRGRGKSMECHRKKSCNKKQRCPIPKSARRAFAMADKFGDEPEKYRQFV